MEIILDVDDVDESQVSTLAWLLSSHVWGFRINHLLLSQGTSIITKLGYLGKVFVDAKLYDPLGSSVSKLLEADMISVQANSISTMKSALGLVKSTKVFSALPNLKRTECQKIYGKPLNEVVWDLAHLSHEIGMHGIIYNTNTFDHLNILKMIDYSQREGITKMPKADFVILGKSIVNAIDPLIAILDFKSQFSAQFP